MPQPVGLCIYDLSCSGASNAVLCAVIGLSHSLVQSCTPSSLPVHTLVPFDYVNGQLLDLDTGVAIYRLAQLKPSTGYEVRISFPASIPAAVKYRVIQTPRGPPSAGRPTQQQDPLLTRLGRRLLDTEKFEFVTDAKGRVQGVADPLLEVRAFRRSVHRDGPKAGVKKLVYNIVLAELVYGVPKDTVPTVLTIVAVVLLTCVSSLVWSSQFFLSFVTCLTADSSKTRRPNGTAIISGSGSGGGAGSSFEARIRPAVGSGAGGAGAAATSQGSAPGTASRKAARKGGNSKRSR